MPQDPVESIIAVLKPDNPLLELAITIVLGVYVLLVIAASRGIYSFLRARGYSHSVAVYFNRKILHVLGGGVVALLVPIIYSSPLFPFMASMAMAGFLMAMRRRGGMRWFQTEDNAYEVNFNIAWGTSLLVLWVATGDPLTAILPPLFISIGDSVTGIVRNIVFARRTKHWIGNVAMGLVVLPLGYVVAGLPGLVAGAVSTVIERYEAGVVDDNILISLSATLVLLVFELA